MHITFSSNNIITKNEPTPQKVATTLNKQTGKRIATRTTRTFKAKPISKARPKASANSNINPSTKPKPKYDQQ